MKIYIDQSGKIETTNRLSVVAASNNKQYSVSISSKEKKVLQSIFRKAGKPRQFVIQTFTSLVYLCLKGVKPRKPQVVCIDKEYPGHEPLIKSYLVQLGIPKESIRFELVGKKSKAHETAYKAYKNKRSNRKIKHKEVLSLILKVK